MKKYYFKESGNEVKFGDRISLDLTQELDNGKHCHKHLDCIFFPGLVGYLKDEGIIEEKEVEEEVDNEGLPLDIPHDEDEGMTSLLNSFYELTDRVDHLEEELHLVKSLGERYASQMDKLLDMLQTQICTKKK